MLKKVFIASCKNNFFALRKSCTDAEDICICYSFDALFLLNELSKHFRYSLAEHKTF